jgi:hypothetical protein
MSPQSATLPEIVAEAPLTSVCPPFVNQTAETTDPSAEIATRAALELDSLPVSSAVALQVAEFPVIAAVFA